MHWRTHLAQHLRPRHPGIASAFCLPAGPAAGPAGWAPHHRHCAGASKLRACVAIHCPWDSAHTCMQQSLHSSNPPQIKGEKVVRPYTPGKALQRHSPLNSAVQASCHSLYDSPATLRLPSRQAAAACHTSNMQLPLVALPSRQLHWTTSEATSTLSSRHGRAQMAGGAAVQLAAGRPAVAAHSLTHGTSHLALFL